MKTINFLKAFLTILLVGIFFSVNIYGKNPVKDTKYPPYAKQIKQILEQTVKFPDCGMSLHGQGIAEVIFAITDDGKASIKEISANCKDLELYVREKLKEATFANVNHPKGQFYKITFIFSYM